MIPIQRMSRRVRRIVRYYYLRLVRIDDSPEKIAGGVALGVFLGIFPTFGVGLILAVALASWLHVNRAAAILGSLIMNPLTTPFFWTLSTTVGALVFQVENAKILEEARRIETSWAAIFGWGALVYLVGNTIVSAVFAGASYVVTKRLAAAVHAKRRQRRHRRALRRAAAAAAAKAEAAARDGQGGMAGVVASRGAVPAPERQDEPAPRPPTIGPRR